MKPSPTGGRTLRPLTRNDLRSAFLSGSKSRDRFRIGVEWEKIGVDRGTGRAIPYSGPRGVRAIFEALCEHHGWRPAQAGGEPIALRKGDSSITLEPGGQIELSGRPCRHLSENALELRSHLDEIKRVSDPLDIAWLGIGAQPFSTGAGIEWVPKPRYALMREALARDGTHSHVMMKETASIQVSVDFEDAEDAARKLRLGMALAPALTAMFANSPIERGLWSGYWSRRSHAWLHTAPGRTGLIRAAFEPSFGIDDYLDHALAAPLLFVVRDGRWIDVSRMPFSAFLEKGRGELRATLEDWRLHLTTIFTEARLKDLVEIRSADCQRKELAMAVPALVKGLFYDPESSRAAWELLRPSDFEEHARLRQEAARRGLQAQTRGRKLSEICRELAALARSGLLRLVAEGLAERSETGYLTPLEELLRQEKVPGQLLMDCVEGAQDGPDKVRRILRCAAI